LIQQDKNIRTAMAGEIRLLGTVLPLGFDTTRQKHKDGHGGRDTAVGDGVTPRLRNNKTSEPDRYIASTLPQHGVTTSRTTHVAVSIDPCPIFTPKEATPKVYRRRKLVRGVFDITRDGMSDVCLVIEYKRLVE
jgi:hypothetical protein